jgi:putative ABC transport system permease protein
VLAGALATVIYASSKQWAIVMPVEAWAGGIASAVLIGAFAGLMRHRSRLPDAAHRGIADSVSGT